MTTSIRDHIRQMVEEAEQHEMETHALETRPQLAVAVPAFVRREVELPGEEKGVRTVYVPSADTLEQDGCDFIEALYFYLAANGCPAAAREFVACLCGMSGGTYSEYIKAIDEDFAARMGCSPSTVAYRRRKLIEWMNRENRAVIDIIEGNWDHTIGKNKPTQYRVNAVQFAAEIIRFARSNPDWIRGRRVAIKSSASRVKALREAANEIAEDTGQKASVKPRNPKRMKDLRADTLAKRKTILTLLGRCRDNERKRGESARKFWEQLKKDGDEVIGEMTIGYPEPDER